MKTQVPLIVTAQIAENDLQPFDFLRQKHFPPARNFLKAHLTMFYRLPGEYRERILAQLEETTSGIDAVSADVTGIRHIGAGVAFSIESDALAAIRGELKSAFIKWLGSQDMQIWRPHITVQNKASKAAADDLYRELRADFRPHSIRITGVDLWKYLDGPWEQEASIAFSRKET